jgi:multidrug efflux pump subunit AcrA (membrane-fusion protein)
VKVRRFLERVRLRTWIVAGVVVVVVAGGSVYWFGFGPTAASATAASPTTTVAASLQTIEQTVSGTGTLTPTTEDDVDFAASGTVTSVKVKAGSTVKAGQTLATIDTLTEKANLLTAKANLAAAQSTLSSAESSSAGAAQIAADKASVSVAAAAVTTAKTEYAGTTLVSPIAGLVTTVNLAVGDVVSGGTSTSSASSGGASSGSATATTSTGSATDSASTGSATDSTSTADFTVVGTKSWDVSVSLGASDIKNIKVGQQVDLSTDENASFFGTVTSIGLLPSTTTGAATYPVVVTVTGSPTELYDGVTVTAKIVYERRTNVLTVPSAAITTAKGVSTVEVVKNGTTTKTTVTVGETSGNLTEITKGISAGAEVQVTRFTPGTGNGTTGTRGTGNFGGNGTGGNFTPPSGGTFGGPSTGSGTGGGTNG